MASGIFQKAATQIIQKLLPKDAKASRRSAGMQGAGTHLYCSLTDQIALLVVKLPVTKLQEIFAANSVWLDRFRHMMIEDFDTPRFVVIVLDNVFEPFRHNIRLFPKFYCTGVVY